MVTLTWLRGSNRGFQGLREDQEQHFTTRHLFYYSVFLNCWTAQQLIKPKKKENKARPLSANGTFIKLGLCNLLSSRKDGRHAAKEAHFPAEADKHL